MRVMFDAAFLRWLDTLEGRLRSRAYRAIYLLRDYGSQLRMPYSRKVRGALFELRIRGALHVRMLYVYHGAVPYSCMVS